MSAMSASFTKRARYLTVGGLATLALGVAAQLAVVPGASSVATTTLPLHQSTPITNSGFGEKGDCDGSPADWGWHFVVSGNDTHFVKVTTTFEDAGTIVTTVFGPPSDKHAYVYTSTDDTLLSASAEVTGADDKTNFVLSHTCAGGENETPTPTPSETVSETPSATPSETVSETPSSTPSETVSETPSSTPSETVSETPSSTPSETVSETPSESVAPTESESVSPTETSTPSTTPSEEVLPTRFTNLPSETVEATETPAPSVSGVKVVRPGALPSTGTPFPVGLLLLLGVGMVVGGMVLTVTGEPVAGKHRR
jgi:hypothetical protein